MIDFSKVKGITIPEGVVTQIADAQGRVIWAMSGGKVILQVEKITSDTYAGETTYTGEQFILLDIYPKTNGTVTVTYGGLTKTITDTSGVEEPNAQQVFFGTFNGVSDSVSTPASGTLIIEGDYYAFGCGSFQATSKEYGNALYRGIIGTVDVGNSTMIPARAFGDGGAGGCEKMTAVNISDTVKTIKSFAFAGCTGLTSIYIGAGVESIESGNAFDGCYKTDIIVESRNKYYSEDGGALFNKNKTTLIAYPAVGEAYTVPSTVTDIGECAFYELDYTRGINYTITVPTSVTNIGRYAFHFSGGAGKLKVRVKMLSTTPPTLGSFAFYVTTNGKCYHEIIVPKGSGAAYKEAEEWSNYAAFITEAS